MDKHAERRKDRRQWIRNTPFWKLSFYCWIILYFATVGILIAAEGLQQGSRFIFAAALVSLPFGLILSLWARFMVRKDFFG